MRFVSFKKKKKNIEWKTSRVTDGYKCSEFISNFMHCLNHDPELGTPKLIQKQPILRYLSFASLEKEYTKITKNHNMCMSSNVYNFWTTIIFGQPQYYKSKFKTLEDGRTYLAYHSDVELLITKS